MTLLFMQMLLLLLVLVLLPIPVVIGLIKQIAKSGMHMVDVLGMLVPIVLNLIILM